MVSILFFIEHLKLWWNGASSFTLLPLKTLYIQDESRIWGFNFKYLPHVVAIKAMNKVASHINEMQKLHEEYGAVFDQLINEQTADKKEVAHINVSALSPVNDPVTYLLFF